MSESRHHEEQIISDNNETDQGEQIDRRDELMNLLVIQTPTSIEQNTHSRITHPSMELSRSGTQGDNLSTNLQQINCNNQRRNTGESITQCPVEPLSKELLTIRLKFLDDTQMIVQTHEHMLVGVFKRKHFLEHLEQGKIIRLIFQGRLMRDDYVTLGSYGIHDQCVIHCHIGTRPYATQNNEHLNGNEIEHQAVANSALSARLTSFSVWIDLLFLHLWNIIMMAWEWSNRTENDIEENRSYLLQIKENVRRYIRLLLEILFGASIRNINAEQRADTRFNVGQLFVLLVFLKFLFLWSLVLFFPHFADRRSIFLLSVLTTTAGLYFYFNRANSLQTRMN